MRDFIKKHYGSQKQCAAELGVSEKTVGNWMKRNPRGILKHAKSIIENKNTTYLQLHGEVEYREHELEVLEPTRET
jgi:DNA-binding XRE family transcriptional regulator